MISDRFKQDGDTKNSYGDECLAVLQQTPWRDIVHHDGRSYAVFRRSLRPHYLRVALDLTIGYAVLLGTVVAAIWFDSFGTTAHRILAAFLAMILVGAALSFLGNFLHEAAHFNLLPDRKWNDIAANLLIGVLVGQGVGHYRKVHRLHHKHLGTTADPEQSYFNRLDVWFLAKSALLWHAFVTMFRRDTIVAGSRARKDPVRFASATVHFGIAMGLVFVSPLAAIAWLGGILCIFPLFTAVRQVLEHRRLDADRRSDYSVTDHGLVARNFHSGILATVIGSAGFRYHLLHHWDPTISYTRLRDVSEFLLGTNVAPILRRSEARYLTVFRTLIHN